MSGTIFHVCGEIQHPRPMHLETANYCVCRNSSACPCASYPFRRHNQADVGCRRRLAGSDACGPLGGRLLHRKGLHRQRWRHALHRMSNSKLLLTPHRVINPTRRERYSAPFFFFPNVSATIAPFAGTGPAMFEPLNFRNFLRRELDASYDAHRADQTDP